MEKKSCFIDLHIHSIYSDGHFSVKELVIKAHENNTSFMAIADHDSIKSLNELKNELFDGMISTSSIEFSTFCLKNGGRIKLHLLGYGFNPNDERLNQLLIELKNRRLYMHTQFLIELKKHFNNLPLNEIEKLDIERYCWFDRDLLACIKRNIDNPDLLLKYYEYFNTHKLRYGLEYPLKVEDVIETINEAGGVPVLAHPMAYNLPFETIQQIIKYLVAVGLKGIEVYQSDCSSYDSSRLLSEVEKYNLLYSAGSDFHRTINSDGRKISTGIDNNLCINKTTVTDYLLEKKLVFKRTKKLY